MKIHVSPNSLRFQNGTRLAPFASVQAARDHLRSMRERHGSFNAQVVLHPGTYSIDQPLVFDERDSAPPGCRTVYRASRRGRARIQGGEVVYGWRRHNDHVWCVDVGSEPLHVLYENGARAHPARWPSRGYLRLLGSVDAESRSLRFDPEDVPAFAPRDAAVSLWPGDADWNWFNELHLIERLEHTAGVLDLKTQPRYAVHHGVRFFFQNALEFLDSPGEFYHDRTAGTLYYYPRREPIEEQRIVRPRVKSILLIRGSDSMHPVSGLRFEGLELTSSDFGESFIDPAEVNGENTESHAPAANLEGAVVVENAMDIWVRDCKIHNIGYSGVVVRGDVAGTIISGNLIEDVGYNGVFLIGRPVGQQDTNKGHVVSNNLIRHGGRTVGHGAGIQVMQSGDNRIVHNEVHGFPRYCISLKGLQFNRIQALRMGGDVTWENHWRLLHTRRNFIGFNDVWDANGDSQDSAPIESWAAGQGNVIHHNYIHDSGVSDGVGFGIYLDDESSDFQVTMNLISRIQNKTCLYIKGFRNAVHDNILLCNFTQFAATLESCSHISFERNLIADSGDDVYEIAGPFDPVTHSIDNNHFVSSRGRYGVARMTGVCDIDGWRRVTGLDRNSVVAEKNDSGRLTGTSADSDRESAESLPISGFDMRKVGLRPSFRIARTENPRSASHRPLKATAFDSWYRNRPSMMIDGVATTRWTALKPLYAGQWICLDQGTRHAFEAITITCGENYPENCAVYLSNDGRRWGQAVCSATGRAPAFTIHTGRKRARFVRVEATSSNRHRIWAVTDVQLHARRPRSGTIEPATSVQDTARLLVNPSGWSAVAGWTATDSLTDEGSAGNAHQAIDNDWTTTWSRRSYQFPGQWFVVDLGRDHWLTGLELECGDGYPGRLSVYRSAADGEWSEEPESVYGMSEMAVRFEGALARYVGLVQVSGFREQPWSIRSLRVVGSGVTKPIVTRQE